MKTSVRVLALLLAFAACVNAGESLTIGNKTYEDVRYDTVTRTTVTIYHKAGVGTVRLEQLPPEVQERLGYTPAPAPVSGVCPSPGAPAPMASAGGTIAAPAVGRTRIRTPAAPPVTGCAGAPIQGSATWQAVFLGVAAVFLLYLGVSGWRDGVARQGVKAAAVVCGYATAWFGRHLLIGPLRGWLGWPDLVLTPISGGILALTVCFGLGWIGARFFRRTKDQPTPERQLAYGLGGAGTGVLMGLFFVWLLVLGVRLTGAVAAAGLAASPEAQAAGGGLHAALSKMKASLDLGVAGGVTRATDPFPPKVYEILAKLARVVADPEAVDRFMTWPGVKELAAEPKIHALQDDPTVAAQFRAREFLPLLSNPKLVDAANDPELGRRLRDFELEKALDYALTRDQQTPPTTATGWVAEAQEPSLETQQRQYAKLVDRARVLREEFLSLSHTNPDPVKRTALIQEGKAVEQQMRNLEPALSPDFVTQQKARIKAGQPGGRQ